MFEHHFKETIITILPGIGGLYAALESTNTGVKILVGGLTSVYIFVRILLAWKEYKSK